MKILIIFAMMGWGLVWPLSKMMTEIMRPEQASAIRFIIVTLSFLPIIWYYKMSFIIPRYVIIPVFFTGILNALYTYLMYIGFQYGDAGSAGVIVEVLSPIIAAFLWNILRKNSFLKREKWGLFFGIISGLFLVNLFGNFHALMSPFNIIYLFAALTWALLVITSRYATEGIHAIVLNFYVSLITVICLLPSFWLFDSKPLVEIEYRFWIMAFLAAVFCTTFSTTIYYKALHVLGVTQGGVYALLAPVFALAFSWLMLGEILQWHTIVGGIIAVIAIYLINYFDSLRFKKKNRKSKYQQTLDSK